MKEPNERRWRHAAHKIFNKVERQKKSRLTKNMGKTAAHSVAQKKLALPTFVGIAQTVFCAGTLFALF